MQDFSSANFKYSNLNTIDLELSNYMAWMRNSELGKFIEGVRQDFSTRELKEYIEGKNE